MSKLFLIAMLALPCAIVFSAEAPDAAALEAHKKRLLEIAKEYESKYERADDGLRWAPLLCDSRGIANLKPSTARFSATDDETAHGRKLYFVFTSNPHTYHRMTTDSKKELTGDGLVIVKESWTPKETKLKELPPHVTTPPGADPRGNVLTKNVQAYTKKDDKIYHAETKSALFIMFKTDAKAAETDEGWVYGTVSADGKEVMTAGRVASCMKCHQDAPHGRLFGLPVQKAEEKK